MRNWNDLDIDWKDPLIIEEWTYSNEGICYGCYRKYGKGHEDMCDIERCNHCGAQAISCPCNYKKDL